MATCDKLIQKRTETDLKHFISISRGTQGMEECVHPSDCVYSRGKVFINLERDAPIDGRRFGLFSQHEAWSPCGNQF